jgi:hypothetical protein
VAIAVALTPLPTTPPQVEIVQRREHRAAFALPTADEVREVGDGLVVDGVERFVEHDEGRSDNIFPKRCCSPASPLRGERPVAC